MLEAMIDRLEELFATHSSSEISACQDKFASVRWVLAVAKDTNASFVYEIQDRYIHEQRGKMASSPSSCSSQEGSFFLLHNVNVWLV